MKNNILILILLVLAVLNQNIPAQTGVGISPVGSLSSFSNKNTIIITHGYTKDVIGFPITASKWKHYVWQFAMADAVSNNRDIYLIRKAEVYKVNLQYLDFQLWTQNELDTPIENLIGNPGQFTPDQNKNNIFIFDWTLESAINWHGYAEAAADVLSATLLKIGKEYPFLLAQLHFIGHSRGCVINSEAIQRLIYWASNNMLPTGLIIDENIHMTTLDAHPAGHWNKKWWWVPYDLVLMDDDNVNSSNIKQGGSRIGVVGWKGTHSKTAYIDNYFQNQYHLSFIGLDKYPGLNFTNPVANNNLSNKLPQNTSAHGLVHTWYHGTVSSLAINDNFGVGSPNIERTSWYNSNLGKTEGMYYSINRPGDLNSMISVENNLINVSDDRLYSTKHLIFNGDFTKNDNLPLISLSPGWSYQNGTFSKDGGIFNNSAKLDDDNNLLIHNSLYIPTNMEKIHFRMRVTNPSPLDHLKLYIGDELIQAYAINKIMVRYKWFEAYIPSSKLGTVDQIKFELTTTDQNYATLYIDDVAFVPNTRIRSTVACPVDFHIYDNLGNHTGPINDSTYVEEIPGSEYFVYEDSTGDKIKTVYLDPLNGDGFYIFLIESRDTTASFTYEIEDYSDTSSGTITHTFNNIYIEPNTVATCTLNISVQIPELLVDLDGNGITDSIYTPNTTGLCFGLAIDQGWNLISLPYISDLKLKTELFPEAVTNAFWFNGSYVVKDTLEVKKGYWIKFDQQLSADICGNISNDTISIVNGWNLIGSLDKKIPVSQITTEPSEILTSNFFRYVGSYQSVDTLIPGYGYWIKSNDNGVIILNSTLKKEGTILPGINNDWLKITVSDAFSRRVHLYLSNEIDKQKYALPPLPPVGAFDVRFESGLMVEELNNSDQLINISGASYPVRINVNRGNISVRDIINGQLINQSLSDGDELIIYDSRIEKIIVGQGNNEELPISYTLEQNYPNPFNSNTIIKFSIADEVQVNLSIYNVLGEKVAEIKNEIMKPGRYEVEFNSSKLASGIYLYKLQSGDYLEVKKMMLLK